jgi:processing peptidase subunit beta
LPFGEIPEPLKYVRPFNHTTLSNGIKVCTEASSGATAYVGVYVGAGSRNESLQTTGTSYLLQKMLTRGTSSKSKTEFLAELDNMGASWSGQSEREWTGLGMQIHKSDSAKAVSMLGDAICNATLNPAELE